VQRHAASQATGDRHAQPLLPARARGSAIPPKGRASAPGLRGIQHPRLGREALGFQLAGGGQNMGMMVTLIAFAVGRMDRHIDGHAIAADQLLGELAGDLRPVFGADLGRQGQLPFTGGDRVAAGLAGLGFVPESGPVRGPVWGVLWCKDEGLHDPLLAGVIVDAPGAAFDRLHGEVVAGHPPYPAP